MIDWKKEDIPICSCCGKPIVRKIYLPYKKHCGCGKDFLICDKNISICPLCEINFSQYKKYKIIKGRGFEPWLAFDFRSLKRFLRLYPNGKEIMQQKEKELVEQGHKVFRYGFDYSYSNDFKEVEE